MMNQLQFLLTMIAAAAWSGTAPAEAAKPLIRAANGLFDSSKSDLGLDQIRGQHVIIYRATPDGYKFCHHSNLALFRDRLYLMWSNGLVSEDFPGQRILYCTSGDGVNWTNPAQLADDRDGKGICVAAGFHTTDRKLTAFYTATGGKNFHADTALTARQSADGKQWSAAKRITSGFFIEGPRRFANGRLLICGEYVGDARKSKRMRLLYSDDSTAMSGWKEARIEPPNLKDFGYTEPNWFQRSNGDIVLAFRNYSGHLFASTSSNQGESWTTPMVTNFPDSTARFCIGKLLDGSIYLINNSRLKNGKRGDRGLLTIALSSDGQTFDSAFVLRGEPTKMRYPGKAKRDGWQYPHAIVWKKHLYVAYSINKEDVAVTRIELQTLRK